MSPVFGCSESSSLVFTNSTFDLRYLLYNFDMKTPEQTELKIIKFGYVMTAVQKPFIHDRDTPCYEGKSGMALHSCKKIKNKTK